MRPHLPDLSDADEALYDAICADDIPGAIEALEVGGSPFAKWGGGCLFKDVRSREMLMLLVKHGVDVDRDITAENAVSEYKDLRRMYLNLPENSFTSDECNALIQGLTWEEFEHGWRRSRFGNKNPERINERLWDVMIRTGKQAYDVGKRFERDLEERGLKMERYKRPIWCADRFGQSLTDLKDICC